MRSDRRPGTTDTRARILTAARQEFATKGFRGATTRSIAGAAGVDVALLSHLRRRYQPKGSPPKLAYRSPPCFVWFSSRPFRSRHARALRQLRRAMDHSWVDPPTDATLDALARSLVEHLDALSNATSRYVGIACRPLWSRICPSPGSVQICASLGYTPSRGIGPCMWA